MADDNERRARLEKLTDDNYADWLKQVEAGTVSRRTGNHTATFGQLSSAQR